MNTNNKTGKTILSIDSIIHGAFGNIGGNHKIKWYINSYIIAGHNKEDMNYAPYRKRFDFTEGAKNVLIRPDNKVEEDSVIY